LKCGFAADFKNEFFSKFIWRLIFAAVLMIFFDLDKKRNDLFRLLGLLRLKSAALNSRCFTRVAQIFFIQTFVLLLIFVAPILGQSVGGYEGVPISGVEIFFENQTNQGTVVRDQLLALVRGELGDTFSVVKNRNALQKLFESERVASARIEAMETSTNPRRVSLRFVIKRTTSIERVLINVGAQEGDREVTEEELLLRLNLLAPGTTLTERAVQQSADAIQSYLRERGFYQAEVNYARQPPATRETSANVTFNVVPNAQARVERFNLNIVGFDNAKLLDELQLQPGKRFSQQKLREDFEKIRNQLVAKDFLAANLEDPQVVYDADKNSVEIALNGNVNATVEVKIVDENGEEIDFRSSTLRNLLPIKREGTLDASAIEEGVRRLRTRLQEDGYFFAEVEAVCGVDELKPEEANVFPNNTAAACGLLSGANFAGRRVSVVYRANRNRRLRLTSIRIEGTDELPIAEIKPALRSQEANALAVIPRLGYGRGYTSRELLEYDRGTIETLMRELGYRRATARVRQGVSPDGENLIITFVVTEGPRTFVSEVEITGNTAFTDDRLKAELPAALVGREFSRARTRTGNTRILDLYAAEGYIEARGNFSIVELSGASNASEERIKIVYNIENEGRKTFVNRVLTIGNTNVKRASILESVPVKPGDVLQADKLTEGERNLYATDAFRQANITTEMAGEKPDGTGAVRDVLVNIEEAPPRILSYGGGYSTDLGPTGFVDIRHVNLLGRLYQGGARIRASRRQQLVQLDFTNPRFLRESAGRFAPLTISAQYLRDTGVTRFFRTTLDQGALGIVQRLDEEGNPIDEFGRETGEPSINRYSVNIETSRTINRKSRSLLFVRYRYEDVRLINIRSLLVAPLLEPDRVVRISGFGAIFSRDTRENCNNRRTLLERIRTGEEGNPCRYSASDATKGEYLTVDYQLSARFLGGNTSFNRVQATYQRYLQFRRLNNTVLAGRAQLGLASLFQVRDRDGNGTIDETDRTLPISERFFAGGSTTLRGFEFEAAGPRRAVVPQGIFRDRNNNPVSLTPFTVPFGGNALAIVNVEARVPFTDFFQIVPFYDGGNVFRRVSEIFKPRASTPGDIENFNLRALWTNTVGLGFRLKLPVGGSFAVDYGYLLNPPEFLVPQPAPTPPAVFRVRQGQLHFRFTQAF
jgi:outer membrane protein insertion porin family